MFNAVGLSAETSPTSSPQPCSPAPGNACSIPNLGQVYHILTYTVTGSPTFLDIRLEGSNDGTNWFPISSDATNIAGGQVYGIGFYAAVRANLVQFNTGTGKTVTVQYLGTSTLSSAPLGFYNPAQSSRAAVWNAQAASANSTVTIGSPYGSTGGYFVITPISGGGLPSGSTLTVSALIGNSTTQIGQWNLATSGLIQTFYVPAAPTTEISAIFTSGGASAAQFNGYYQFYTPGQTEPYYNTHITTATSTVVKNGTQTSRILHTVTVNTSQASSTATIFDSGSASCASPASTIAVIDTSVKGTYLFDTFVTQSVCVTTTGSTPPDITVTTQ